MDLSQVETEGLFIIGAAFLERLFRYVLSPFVMRWRGLRRVKRVKDGDSVLFETFWFERLSEETGDDIDIRINGINAADKEPLRTKSRKALAKKLGETARVFVIGNDKYGGRLQGKIFKGRTDVGEWMVKKGLARWYDGGKRDPNY